MKNVLVIDKQYIGGDLCAYCYEKDLSRVPADIIIEDVTSNGRAVFGMCLSHSEAIVLRHSYEIKQALSSFVKGE